MNRNDVADLLTGIAAYDQRTIGETDVIAWHAAIGDLPKDVALDAIAIHHKTSNERIKPFHVNEIARNIRNDRAERGLTGAIDDGCPFCDGQGWIIDRDDRYGWAIRCEHDSRQRLEKQPGHVPHSTPTTPEEVEHSLDAYWSARRDNPTHKEFRRKM